MRFLTNHPNTTGLTAIDYRLTDAVCDPPGAESWHSEQLVRLPGLFCTYEPPADAPAVTPPPSRLQSGTPWAHDHMNTKLDEYQTRCDGNHIRRWFL